MLCTVLQYIAAELPAGSAADPTAGDRKVWAVIAYIMTALTVLLFLFTLVMLRRIKIAVATLKVSCMHTCAISSLKTQAGISIVITLTSCTIKCVVKSCLVHCTPTLRIA